MDALLVRLSKRQTERQALEAELSASAFQQPTISREDLGQRLRAKLADCRGLLRRNVAEGRAVLRALLIGPLRSTPIVEERRRRYVSKG